MNNRTVSESDRGDQTRSSVGARLNRAMSSNSAVRVGLGSPPVRAERDRRLRSLVDPENEFGGDFDGRGGSDGVRRPPATTRHAKERRDTLRSQRSSDSGGGTSADSDSQAGGSGATSGGESNQNGLKSIWKKTVNKLIKKMKTTDNSASSAASAEPKSPPAGGSVLLDDDCAGEIDPVYSFLKLTSVMPRQGTTSVIPGQGHRCCPGSKSDTVLDDADIDDSTYTHSIDPARCQCPCHLPERLEACHYAWKKAFVIKKV